jgi:hypothetical protein
MYLRVGNSDSTEDSAGGCRASESRIFWGYDPNGCVCSGVNTGADCSDLWGNAAPACYKKKISFIEFKKWTKKLI